MRRGAPGTWGDGAARAWTKVSAALQARRSPGTRPAHQSTPDASSRRASHARSREGDSPASAPASGAAGALSFAAAAASANPRGDPPAAPASAADSDWLASASVATAAASSSAAVPPSVATAEDCADSAPLACAPACARSARRWAMRMRRDMAVLRLVAVAGALSASAAASTGSGSAVAAEAWGLAAGSPPAMAAARADTAACTAAEARRVPRNIDIFRWQHAMCERQARGRQAKKRRAPARLLRQSLGSMRRPQRQHHGSQRDGQPPRAAGQLRGSQQPRCCVPACAEVPAARASLPSRAATCALAGGRGGARDCARGQLAGWCWPPCAWS